MTVHQREQLDQFFAAALAVPVGEQAAWLAHNCLEPEIRREVESLLAFASQPPEGIVGAIADVAHAVASPNPIGQRVGLYRLTARIGHGGMGAVYHAIRDDGQFQKTVAIKMLRFPDGDQAVIRRFRHERQILASLEHPHIARLLDGGEWVPPGGEESQPYLVMEYVEGLPLTAYCQENQLTVRERLALFQQICGAVSCAHRELVVHRDIKPGNILVTADGIAKLLDFGVAKLLDPSVAHGDALTVTGSLPLTPDYASPEQIRGERVSTLADVYSLGAVLYELLTGRRPHPLPAHHRLGVTRAICESAVPSPETGSELDVIVLKATQNDPARRYQSADQLAEDIRRYLAGLPVTARPDTLRYRAAKFVYRHWLGLAAVAAVAVTLIGGIAVSTREALRANRERQRADTESATAKAVNEFLRDDLLAQAGASAQAQVNTTPDPNLTVRTALDRAASRIGARFAAKPLVEASIRQTMGAAYHDLGLFPESQLQMERVLELRGRTLGRENPDVLSAMSDLAGLYIDQGKYAQARSLLTGIVDARRRILGPEHRQTLNAMNDLGELFSYEGDDAQAEALLTSALQLKRRALGPGDPDTLTGMSNLGVLYRIRGKDAQAEALLFEAARIRERTVGAEHPDTLTSRYELAVVYQHEGKYSEAELLLTDTLKRFRRVMGPDHPYTLTATSGLVSLYQCQKKYMEAEALEKNLVAIRRSVLGGEHPDTINSLDRLAEIYDRRHKYDRAEKLLERVTALRRRVTGPQHRDTLATLASLGQVRIHEQKYATAEPPLREALRSYQKTMPEHWRRYRTESLMGASLAGQGKLEEAEPLLLSGYQGLLQRQSSIPVDYRSDLAQTGEWIVRLYRNWGRDRQAAEWRRRLQSAEPTGPWRR